MTDRELMQQVLDDICGAKLCEINSMSSRHEMFRLMDKAITALSERLKQPERQRQEMSTEEIYAQTDAEMLEFARVLEARLKETKK